MNPTDREKAQEILETFKLARAKSYDEALERLIDLLAAALSEARKDAIEECAKVADTWAAGRRPQYGGMALEGAADAIRALKGTP